MSPISTSAQQGPWSRLPPRLRPRAKELPEPRRTRLIETTMLALAGLLLAIATVNDVVLQAKVNHRLVADLATWRTYTHHDYRNVSVEQDIYGHTTHEVVCGNTTPGPPRERVQICLVMTGPVSHGRRAVQSGWYLPPNAGDLSGYRYGCFGPPTPHWPCPG
jgi:hypothetical protein